MLSLGNKKAKQLYNYDVINHTEEEMEINETSVSVNRSELNMEHSGYSLISVTEDMQAKIYIYKIEY